jgi:hypothetical protein
MSGLLRLLSGWQGSVAALVISAALAGSAVWKFQQMRYQGEIARLQAALVSYQAKVASANAQLVQAQAQVVTQVEIRYRDRIKVVKEKGDTLIKEVPIYVTPQDSLRFGVNIGFVHLFNAASSGTPARPPAESDREPAGISLAEIAETLAFNANICHQWREQALGCRAFYRNLQAALDKKR